MGHKMKRVGVTQDMTPLVDVAFLLLTFFMFTAKFKSEAESEQKFEVQRPVASADTTKMPESNAAVVKVAIDPKQNNDTVMFYAVMSESNRKSIYAAVPAVADQADKAQIQIPGADTTVLAELVLATRRTNVKAKFLIDADKRIRFNRIEQIMNTFRSQSATAFNFVTVKSQ